jgi:hypothetical protein
LHQKSITYVEYVEELDDTYENLIFAEFVLEKKLMLENYHELENQVGKNKKFNSIIILL